MRRSKPIPGHRPKVYRREPKGTLFARYVTACQCGWRAYTTDREDAVQEARLHKIALKNKGIGA